MEPRRLNWVDRVALALGLASAGILLFAGAERLLHTGDYVRIVASHGIWSTRDLKPLVLFQGAFETLLGGIGVWVLLRHAPMDSVSTRLPFITAMITYGLYASYAAYLLRRRGGVPCACDRNDDRTSLWTIVRAAILTVASGVPASLGIDSSLLAGGTVRSATVVLASVAFALVVWLLPAALADPWSPVIAGLPQDTTS